MNTLFKKPRDFSDVTVGKTFQGYKKYLDCLEGKHPKAVCPAAHAIAFYYCEHFMMDVENKYGMDVPSGELYELVSEAVRAQNLIGLHIFFYLFLIVHREARYFHANSTSKYFFDVEQNKQYREYMLGLLKGSSGPGANKLLEEEGACSQFQVIDFIRVIRDMFNELDYSSAYGGKKWGVIADVLYRFLSGDISLFVMTDAAFALEHNTGNIFNKGVLYNSVDTSFMKTVLDAQRGGQIPMFMHFKKDVLWDVYLGKFVTFHNRASLIFTHYKDLIDWDAIQKAGAVLDHSGKTTKKVEEDFDKLQLYPGFIVNVIERNTNTLEKYL